MAEYVAPLKDMQFVLSELAGLEQVTSLPRFVDATPDVIAPVLDEAAKFAGEVLSPLNIVGDQKGAVCENNQVQETEGFAEAYRQFAEGGWVSLSGDPEFGGMGLPDCVASAVAEMWSAANSSFALCPMLGVGAMNAIESHASEELKNTYLPKMMSGEWTGTMNLTEPQAGSDLAAVRTKAVPNGDHYLISGTKIFITWGDHQMTDNIVHLVLARTPDAPEGVKGISLFIVPKFLINADGSPGDRNDAYAVSVEHKLGIHASPTCVMSYGDSEGAVGYLVGEENKGLAYMFTMMNHARLNVGVQGVSLSERAYQHAVNYAKERVQGITPGLPAGTIIEHPDIRRMLMTMRALTEASRAVCYLNAANLDLGHFHEDESEAAKANVMADLLTPIAKGWSTEVVQEVASLGVQIHGGMGFIEETGAAQHMRDARITSIYEGTTGIQANDLVGRKFIRDGGAGFSALLAEMQATCDTLDSPELLNIKPVLQQGISDLQKLGSWILENYRSDAALPGAVSFNLLMAAGTTTGGWLMAKAAQVSEQKMSADEQFYSAKLTTAKFFAEHIMPRSQAYIDAAMAGTESIMGLASDQF